MNISELVREGNKKKKLRTGVGKPANTNPGGAGTVSAQGAGSTAGKEPVDLGQAGVGKPENTNPGGAGTVSAQGAGSTRLPAGKTIGAGLGALAGGIAGSALGPAGTVAGAGLGAGLGRDIGDKISNKDWKGVGNVASQAADGVAQTVGAGLGGLYHGFKTGASGGKFTGGIRSLATGGLKTGGAELPSVSGTAHYGDDNQFTDLTKLSKEQLDSAQQEAQQAFNDGRYDEWKQSNPNKAAALVQNKKEPRSAIPVDQSKQVTNNPSSLLPPNVTNANAKLKQQKEEIERLKALSGL